MNILRLINDIASENTYILSTEQAALIIDPGSNGPEIIQALQQLNLPLKAILLTHAHYDHILSVDLVRDTFEQVPVYIAAEEADWLFTPEANLSGLPRHDDMPDLVIRPAEEMVTDSRPYQIADFHFHFRKTPGHSIGGLSIVFDKEDIVFSGDALFRGSIGRTDLPTGDRDQLLDSIRTQLFTLPSHYRVFPGHGMDTTIAREKNTNPFFID